MLDDRTLREMPFRWYHEFQDKVFGSERVEAAGTFGEDCKQPLCEILTLGARVSPSTSLRTEKRQRKAKTSQHISEKFGWRIEVLGCICVDHLNDASIG